LKRLSVIVPVVGSLGSLWLRRLRELKSTMTKIEVILIGNVDGHDVRGLKYIKVRCNRSLARNLGIIVSKGEYILFLDSDQFLSKSLLSELVDLIDRGFDAALIPERFIGLTIWGKASATWKQAIQRIDRDNSCIPRLYSRKALERIGPLRSELTILEDYELCLRAKKLRLKMIWLKNPLIHLEPNNLTEYLKKWSTYAESLPQSIKAVGIKNIARKYSKLPLILIEALRSCSGIGLKLALLSLTLIKFLALVISFLRRPLRR